MKVAAIIGSLRKESLNRQLAETIKERYAEKLELEILEIGNLPHYNQDDEFDPVQSVKEFKQKVQEADAVLLVTPEYNWSIPGVLKNALDWLSRVDKVLIGKPVIVVGAATGPMGTIRAQLQLRQILAALQVKLFPPAGNEILINSAASKFNDGKLTDESTLAFLDQVIDRFVNFVSEK